MLKVLHIISGDLWAGAEVQAFNLLNALRSQCDLRVVLMNEGRLAQELKAVGVATHVIDESQHSAFGILLVLRKKIRAYLPDVIHTHRQKENVLGSLANLFASRSVCVRTVHGSNEFEPRGLKKIQGKIDDLVGRYLQDGIIAVSGGLHDELADRFGPGKVVVIPNGIDASLLNQNANRVSFINDHDKSWHIGLVGRLEPVKRVDLFLQIAKAMLDDLPSKKPLMFHIIGDGSLKAQLEEEAKKMNLDGRVYFHGHRNDVASCILSLDALVMCSDHEGSPMTGLEALALGKPIVAHKVGGLIDMLEPYPEFLVNEQSATAFREALLLLLESPEPISVRLPEMFTAKSNAEKTLSFYKNLLE